MQWVPSALFLGVKRPGCEADHSPHVPRLQNEWSYTSTPQYVFMAWCLVKQRDNYLYLHLNFATSHSVDLPHASFRELLLDQLHCSCTVFKHGEISLYIEYWNAVYFHGTETCTSRMHNCSLVSVWLFSCMGIFASFGISLKQVAETKHDTCA
jgi:hypothetical protein